MKMSLGDRHVGSGESLLGLFTVGCWCWRLGRRAEMPRFANLSGAFPGVGQQIHAPKFQIAKHQSSAWKLRAIRQPLDKSFAFESHRWNQVKSSILLGISQIYSAP
jgi:hypothetical protein